MTLPLIEAQACLSFDVMDIFADEGLESEVGKLVAFQRASTAVTNRHGNMTVEVLNIRSFSDGENLVRAVESSSLPSDWKVNDIVKIFTSNSSHFMVNERTGKSYPYAGRSPNNTPVYKTKILIKKGK